MAENSGSNRFLQAFFAPAVALMGRLNVARKFALLGLMSLIAVVIVVYSLYASLDETIGLSKRELKGLDLIEPLQGSVQIIQQHRGLSMEILGGDQTVLGSRADVENEAGRILGEMLHASLDGQPAGESLRQIGADWERLRTEGLGWTMAENFAAHTLLIDRIQAFGVAIADEYALTQDPGLDTYYLIDTIVNKLPHALEHFGQLRAYSVGTLAKKQITVPQQVEMSTLIDGLDHAIVLLKNNLDKTGRYNPALQGVISAASTDIEYSAQQVVSLVKSDILTGRFAVSPDDFFDMSTVMIDRGYVQLHDALLPVARTLIKARIARAESTLRTSIGLALLLFLVVAYFSVGIARAIAANIRSIARSAQAFAGGDLDERVDVGMRDELGQVGGSFNAMADGFAALLKKSRDNEARLQDLSAHLEERVKKRTVELELAQRLTDSLMNRYRTLMMTSMDGICITDTQGNLVEANDAFCKMLGYTRKEMVGLDVTGWDARSSAEDLRKGPGNLAGACKLFETQYRRKDGTLIDVEVSVNGASADEPGLVFAASRDITERKRAEQEIHNLAFYDALTGLPNRRLFLDRFGAALTASVRHNNYGAVLFIDMDKFKLLNDTLGHDYGDLMLVEVAARIKSCVREMDTVARLGGDEFVVLIESISDSQEEASYKVGLVAEKIRESLACPYHLSGHEHRSSPSIGVSLYRGNDEPVEELLQHADMAMYQAKESGRNTVRFFDPVMQDNVAARAALVSDLRDAIARRQLQLYYQLQVDNNNLPVGAEALLRWVHPQRGTLLPEQFLPIAEESALIVEIGDWVLETACRQLALWGENEKMRDLVLTVNVSARQFAMPDFVDKMVGILRTCPINPARLKLELTENMALENLPGTIEKMHALKALGVCLSMDDFGIRYSSLSSLKQLPLDQIKLGRSFVQDVATDGNVALLVQSIIDMSGRCQISVIAEGVENQAQLASLKERDCIAYQGFLFSKAVPVEEFEKLLG